MKNGVIMQYFEWFLPDTGQLWNELARNASHLAERGISAVWIPPAYKGSSSNDVGYGTYDLFDFGEFDQKGTVRTKYGTRSELENAIKSLHESGIQVILDTVLNHKASGDSTERFQAIEVKADNRNEEVGDVREIEGYTSFEFPGRGDKYSAYKWHWWDFSGLDYDNITGDTCIFRIVGDGKGWSQGVDTENGNYDFLMANDIDHDRQQVRDELFHWGEWAVKTFGFDGLRMDALKHIDYNFTRDFIANTRAKTSPNLYVVGEYWSSDLDTLTSFLEKTEQSLDLFDVPLHFNFHEAGAKEGDYDLSRLLDDSLVQKCPQNAVTFVDNHDSQSGCSLESGVADWFKPLAYALILLMKEGYPCLFYGDYYSENGQASPHHDMLDMLLDIRKKYARGEQTLYFDHPSCVALVRHGDEDSSGLVLLLSNDEDSSKHIELGKEHAGEEWHDISGHDSSPITLDETGAADFLCPGRTFAIWVKS